MQALYYCCNSHPIVTLVGGLLTPPPYASGGRSNISLSHVTGDLSCHVNILPYQPTSLLITRHIRRALGRFRQQPLPRTLLLLRHTIRGPMSQPHISKLNINRESDVVK